MYLYVHIGKVPKSHFYNYRFKKKKNPSMFRTILMPKEFAISS